MSTTVRGSLLMVALGAGSAVVGLVPWLITGLRLPLQNLWAAETSPDSMPLSLLPFSQYAVTLIASILVTGSALAGAVLRATRRRWALGVWPVLLGVAIVQGAAVAQTATTVASGLSDRFESTVYLGALTLGSSAVIVLGLGIAWMIGRASAPVATVAWTVAAVPIGGWISAIIVPFGTAGTATGVQLSLLPRAYWVPGILVGVALGRCGLRTVGSIAAWIVSSALLWVIPPLFTAVSAAVGSRVLAAHPSEMLDYGTEVFRAALSGAGGQWRVVILALIIGVALCVMQAVRGRRASSHTLPPHSHAR